MGPSHYYFGLFLFVLILIDLYCFQAVKAAYQNKPATIRKRWFWAFWGFTFFTCIAMFMAFIIPYHTWPVTIRAYLYSLIFMVYVSKLVVILFLFVDDLGRITRWVTNKLSSSWDQQKETYPDKAGISRSEFLIRSGFFVALLPFTTLMYGMAIGGYKFTVNRKEIALPSLPEAFDGLKVVQISDLHAGSYAFPAQVNKVVELVQAEKPDIILFTGDIINHLAEEMEPFKPILAPLSAPLGIYSVLGNHDYGDYIAWDSSEAKEQNFNDMLNIQREWGWKVLLNESHIIEKDGQQLAITGVENWSVVGNFQRYGDLDKAISGTEGVPAIFLLTHDPSHWEAEVLKKYPQIDMTFAGHTHGMQFGADLPNFKWSPVQYVYKHWYGLYQEGKQYLYVNRGLGFTGFPGRVGMTPEITVFDFYKEKAC